VGGIDTFSTFFSRLYMRRQCIDSDGFVPDPPCVMAYGAAEDEAVRKVKSIALQVLADLIDSGS
jgi:hypothetical protein